MRVAVLLEEGEVRRDDHERRRRERDDEVHPQARGTAGAVPLEADDRSEKPADGDPDEELRVLEHASTPCTTGTASVAVRERDAGV